MGSSNHKTINLFLKEVLMRYVKFGVVAVIFFLVATSLYGQEIIVKIRPFDGSPDSYVNRQIVADTAAAGGLLANRVYEFARDQYYLHNAIFTVPKGRTLRLRAEEGSGRKPIIFLWETGTGSNPTRPPGNFVVLNGGNLEIKNICIAGFYEPEPDRVDGVQGGLINTTAAGSSIILDGVVLSNINGQHVRTGQNTVKVKITNSIFANMGALTTSNLGAGKGIDLREAACDSFIIVNNTFVNYQDRAIRHYNFSNPAAGTGLINYGRIEHNTFVNGMGFHGLLSLGNVGNEIIITNNLFVDAFALGEDSTDATRAAEWANTGEVYANGNNKITWIFTAPNDVTQWKVSNNYYTISDSGWAFLNDFKFGVASPLSNHIQSKLGPNASNAFTQINLALDKIPRLMTNMMRWYESPTGGNRTKNTPSAAFNRKTDDYDRRPIEFYRDTLNCSYSTASVAYIGAEGGFPVGDLNWFPDKKALWEKGYSLLNLAVDGNKDAFYEALTGPNDGHLQVKSYAFNDNGIPTGDADLSAKVWAAWDNDWFYLYEEVMDDTLAGNATNVWEEDCLELKFDPQPTDSVTNSVWETRLTILSKPTAGVVAGDSLNNVAAADKKWARRIIPGGYALELAIKWSAIKNGAETITPAEGNVFGLALCQHDNDGKAKRQASIMWGAVMLDAVWNTPKYHGTVKFLPNNQLQFIPQNNVTGRSNPIPYDGTPFYLLIDGKKDPFYHSLAGPDDGYLQIRSYAYNDNGKPKDDADLSAKVWTAWDDQWFYLYEEVKDDTLSGSASNVWEEDCIELKFDPQPTDSTQQSAIDWEASPSIWDTRFTALAKTVGVMAADSLNNVPDSLKKWKRTKIAGGYVLEMAFQWSVIKSSNGEKITPAVDQVFGMAICQHDNDGKGRQASINWGAALLDAVWNKPKYHGTVKFQADHKLQFIAKNNMTGLINPVPYDGRDYVRTAVPNELQNLPKVFNLAQNYPNPFNPTTQIMFSLDADGPAKLAVFNMVGQKVATLVDTKLAAGYYQVNFDASHLANGIYFYRLESGGKVAVKKMVLLK
jgi:hypothetical protein